MIVSNNPVSAPVHTRARHAASVTPAESGASFADQVAAALEKYLGKSENGSRIEIEIETKPSASGTRQFFVTVKDNAESIEIAETSPDTPAEASAAGASSTPAAPAKPAESEPNHSMMYNGTVQYKPTPVAAPSTAPATVEDAYWATQPPELQILRTIKDEGERTFKAQELASQGFSIDVPIMVWQWDPLMTMRARETAGYTWVPSSNNAPVELGPGISFPGMKAYDAGTPPTGSIPVSTEWAKGLEHTSPWWRPAVVDARVDGQDG